MNAAAGFAYIRAQHKNDALDSWKNLIMALRPGKHLRVPAAGLRRFLLRTSDPYFCDGAVMEFHKKSLGVGIYDVWFEVHS